MPYSLLFIGAKTCADALSVTALEGEFSIKFCGSAQDATEHLRSESFDLAMLGPDLPDMTGLALFRFLRETEAGKHLPVIFLSGRKTDESVAEAFGLGADDYVVLPCDARELAARARAVIRRKHEIFGDAGGPLTIACIQIDPSQRRCLVNGHIVRLRPLEFELLKILMRKSGRILTRSYLLKTVWDIASAVDTRAVDAAVGRLRRALGVRAGRLIETVSKMGYCFRVPS